MLVDFSICSSVPLNSWNYLIIIFSSEKYLRNRFSNKSHFSSKNAPEIYLSATLRVKYQIILRHSYSFC